MTFLEDCIVCRPWNCLQGENLIYSFTRRKEEGIFEAASLFGLKQKEATV